MKMKTLSAILFTSVLALSSCMEATKVSSSSGGASTSGTDTSDGGGNTGGGNTGGGGWTGGSGGGSTCYGNSNDGTGDGFPLRSYNILVAGQGEGAYAKPENTWKPWGNSDNIDSLGMSLLPKIVEARNLMQTDSKLNVRFKLHPQYDPGAGNVGCYGRVTGKSADANEYTKVRFKVSLRDVTCQSGDSNNCTLGGRYQTQNVGPIEVNNCSSILSLGPLRNVSPDGTVLEVWDVRTDQTCAYNDTSCPVNDFLRTSSCWEATMQFSTDYTQNFK